MSTETNPTLTVGDKTYNIADLSPEALAHVNALSRAAAVAQELEADLTVNRAGQQALLQSLQALLEDNVKTDESAE